MLVDSDTAINDYRKKMIELCKSLDLLILKGGNQNDREGEYSYIAENRKSTTDLVIIWTIEYSNNINVHFVDRIIRSRRFPIQIRIEEKRKEFVNKEKEELKIKEMFKWKKEEQERQQETIKIFKAKNMKYFYME